jgi:hypothetical protein
LVPKKGHTLVKLATRSLVLAVLASLCLTVAPLTKVAADTTIPLRGVVRPPGAGGFGLAGFLAILGSVDIQFYADRSGNHLVLTTADGSLVADLVDADENQTGYTSFYVIDGLSSSGIFQGAEGYITLRFHITRAETLVGGTMTLQD